MKQFSSRRVLSLFIIVLFLFQSITALLITYKQGRRLRTSAYNDSVNDLNIMADSILDALRKSDLATVKTLVLRWGEKRTDFLKLRVISPNGFVIAEYGNHKVPTSETYSLETDVVSEGTKIAVIYLSADYRLAAETSKRLRNRLFLAAFIITTVLANVLWLLFRKVAIMPLEDAVKMTELANKEKDVFLANMSHEMRTPLQSILSYHALLSRTQLTDEQQAFIKPIGNAALLLKTLINDILDLTRIEQGNIHIRSIPFDIGELLRSTVEIHRPEAESKGLGLDCFIAPDIPARLKGDPERLGQILHNLVGNAIKFSEKGGIHIEVEPKADLAASGGVCKDVELLFSVRDGGIGIAKDKQDVIFERFKQAHEGYSRRYGGSGLGLPISRKLLQHMGGNIWVESEPNKGSTFYFTAVFDVVGIDEDGGTPSRGIQPAVTDDGRLKKILIVDDERQCSFSMEILLKKENYETATASTGAEALARLKIEAFDLIFMDVSMPEMDGIEATKIIREAEKLTGTHTPIIAVTGHGYDSDIAKFKQAGMDNWLIKPAAYDDLLKMLKNYV